MPDLCKRDDVKLWLTIGDDDTSADSILARLISATSMDFLTAIDRTYLIPAADFTEIRYGNDKSEMVMYRWPVNEINTVQVNGDFIPESSDGIADGFWIDKTLVPEDRYTLSLIGSRFTAESFRTVKIVYNAGYDEVPADIEQAVIDWVAYRYKQRQWIGELSSRMINSSGEQTSFQNILMPESTKAVVARYNRHRKTEALSAKAATDVVEIVPAFPPLP
jgi:hypothetical protein